MAQLTQASDSITHPKRIKHKGLNLAKSLGLIGEQKRPQLANLGRGEFTPIGLVARLDEAVDAVELVSFPKPLHLSQTQIELSSGLLLGASEFSFEESQQADVVAESGVCLLLLKLEELVGSLSNFVGVVHQAKV